MRSKKTRPQLLEQLPPYKTSAESVFKQVGMDYAGPVLTKSGHIRKSTMMKCYVCVFVSFSVKAVHLELVLDLSSAAFISTRHWFVAGQGKP